MGLAVWQRRQRLLSLQSPKIMVRNVVLRQNPWILHIYKEAKQPARDPRGQGGRAGLEALTTVHRVLDKSEAWETDKEGAHLGIYVIFFFILRFIYTSTP